MRKVSLAEQVLRQAWITLLIAIAGVCGASVGVAAEAVLHHTPLLPDSRVVAHRAVPPPGGPSAATSSRPEQLPPARPTMPAGTDSGG